MTLPPLPGEPRIPSLACAHGVLLTETCFECNAFYALTTLERIEQLKADLPRLKELQRNMGRREPFPPGFLDQRVSIPSVPKEKE